MIGFEVYSGPIKALKRHLDHEVDISTKDIEKLGWKGGEELKRTIKGKKLILEPE